LEEKQVIPNKPLLKRNYNVVMMPQGHMQLRSEENILLLKGASVSDIVEKLLLYWMAKLL
jgi:hypothetical protein